MDAIEPRGGALVLVDYQARLMPAIHGGETVVRNGVLLADVARELGIPVIGTEQNPAGLGPNVAQIRERCDVTIAKDTFDACAAGLLAELASRTAGASHLVIAGCEAHVCLLQTALGVLRAGYRVFVASDACGSRVPENHRLAMERLRDAKATIVATEMAAFEWLQTCRHRKFRPVLALLKQ